MGHCFQGLINSTQLYFCFCATELLNSACLQNTYCSRWQTKLSGLFFVGVVQLRFANRTSHIAYTQVNLHPSSDGEGFLFCRRVQKLKVREKGETFPLSAQLVLRKVRNLPKLFKARNYLLASLWRFLHEDLFEEQVHVGRHYSPAPSPSVRDSGSRWRGGREKVRRVEGEGETQTDWVGDRVCVRFPPVRAHKPSEGPGRSPGSAPPLPHIVV